MQYAEYAKYAEYAEYAKYAECAYWMITDYTEIPFLKFSTITIACKLGLVLWPNMLGKQNICKGA